VAGRLPRNLTCRAVSSLTENLSILETLSSFPESPIMYYMLLQFSCGHEFMDERPPDGISDPSRCICAACQPYHATLALDYPCAICGGPTVLRLRLAKQTRMTEREAEEKRKTTQRLP